MTILQRLARRKEKPHDLVSELRRMANAQHDDLSVCAEAADEIERLQTELETVKRRYAPSMTDLMIPPEDINEYLDNPVIAENIRLLADLAEAIEALKPFAAIKNIAHPRYDPTFVMTPFTFEDCEHASAIVEKHK